MKKLLLLASALTAVLTLPLLAAGKLPTPLLPRPLAPASAPSPSATPTFDEMMKSITDGIGEATKRRDEIVKEVKAEEDKMADNNAERKKIVLQALPLAQQAQQGLAHLEGIKTRFEQHGQKCHTSTLEEDAYKECVDDHKEIADAYKAEQESLQKLDEQLQPFRAGLQTLEDDDEARVRKTKTLQEEMSKVEGRIAHYRLLLNQMEDCQHKGTAEAVSQCGQIAWDGATDHPALGDANTVDTRNIRKLSKEERERLQRLPSVQKLEGRRDAPAPPSPSSSSNPPRR
jgi:seryl-tRNA synthetase